MKKILSLLLMLSVFYSVPSIQSANACLMIDPYGHGTMCYTVDPRNYLLPGDPGYWDKKNTNKPRIHEGYKDYGDGTSVREPVFPGEPCIIAKEGPPRTTTSYWDGCGGGGGSSEPPGPPPKPSFVPPTLPTVKNPTTGTYPTWTLNPSTTVSELPRDNGIIRDKEDYLKALSEDEVSIGFTNIPINGMISLSAYSDLYPELLMRYGETAFKVPFPKTMDSVTREESKKIWDGFKASGNTVEVFIFKYDDPLELPQSTKEFFTMDKNKFKFYSSIVDEKTDLTNFKLDKAGTYILGTRVTYDGLEKYQAMPVRVNKFDNYGWLPVSNNAVAQYNDKLINNGWKQSSHNIPDLTAEGSKSLKASSAYNYKHLVTAIGSAKGTAPLTLIKDDTSSYTGTLSLPSNWKVTEILEYKEGFLVSTLNDGIQYVNLKEDKTHKVIGANIGVVNDIFLENGNIYIATNSGLTIGELKLSLTGGTNNVSKVEYLQAKFLSNSEVFSPVDEIDRIEVAIGKIILTPKTNSGVVILDKN